MTKARTVLLLWLGCAAAFAAATEPSMAPQISSVFPRGGRAGSTVEVTLSGANLEAASRIEFTSPGLQAAIVSSDFRKIHARITIASEAETGTHEFRLFTPTGTLLGMFEVGKLPEVTENEPNDSVAAAQAITFPVVINGRADAEDADTFRFATRAGQTLVFDILAARNGSKLDPVLTLMDESGRQIGYCDDYYIEKDARIEHTFARAGNYLIRVSASYSRSGPDADYRLTVTDRAGPLYAIPAGAQRGSSVELTIQGANLSGVDRAWLDAQTGSAIIESRSPTELKLLLQVPAGMAPGRHRLHLAAGDEETAPLRFEISDTPEITVADSAAADPAHHPLLHAPVIVNAEIAPRGEDYLHRVHAYDLQVPKGARYEFRVKSWDLGLRADPVVTLFDADGKELAFEDDPSPNAFIHYASTHDPDLVYKFTKAGRYRVTVRDALYRGGTGFIYRMTVQPTQPDYFVDVNRTQITAYVGRTTTFPAQVHRTGGMHIIETFKYPDNEIENFRIKEIDGWMAPVVVWADGVPAGVTAERIVAEPKNTVFKGNDGEELFVDGTAVDVPLQVSADATPGTYKIHVRAQSTFEGRTVNREGLVVRRNRAVKTSPEQQTDLYLTILKPPPVLVTAPDRLAVTKGEPAHMKLSLYYFERAAGPVVVEAEAPSKGLDVGRVNVPAGGEELEIPVSAAAGSPDSVGKVVLVARDSASGRVLGQS